MTLRREGETMGLFEVFRELTSFSIVYGIYNDHARGECVRPYKRAELANFLDVSRGVGG